MTKAIAVALLLVTTFFWGVTYTVVKQAVARVDVSVFLAQRFLLAALLLVPIAAPGHRRLDRRAFARGCALGLALFATYALQTLALRITSAANTAFLSGLSVVLVPVIGVLFFGRAGGSRMKWPIALAVTGLFLLCTNGSWQLNEGDALAAICAVCISLHLLLTGRFAGESDVAWLTTVEIGVVALCSLGWALLAGEEVFLWRPFLLRPLVFCVLFATIFAYLAQTFTQRYLSPTQTVLIFCLEPVFATIWAYAALGERLALRGAAGAVLILAAMLLAVPVHKAPARGVRS